MTATKNERLNKAYVDNAVDTAMDAQRQYSEELFSRANKRVQEIIEERMKTALETIRPDETNKFQTLNTVETKMPSVARQNAECLSILKAKMSALVQQYETATGFNVRCVYFDHSTREFFPIVKVLAHNV